MAIISRPPLKKKTFKKTRAIFYSEMFTVFVIKKRKTAVPILWSFYDQKECPCGYGEHIFFFSGDNRIKKIRVTHSKSDVAFSISRRVISV